MSLPEARLLYTVAQLAAFLDWSEDSIRREIKAGRLVACRRRSEVVIRHADLLAYLDRLPVVETEAPAAETVPTPIATTRRTSRQRVVRLFDPYAAATR